MKKEQPNMTDKELDNFFRKRSGQFDIPYEPADWVKLKAKLDQQAGQAGTSGPGGHNGAIRLLSIAIILGLIITGIYLRGDKQTTNEMSADTPGGEILDQASITNRASDPPRGLDIDET